MMSDAWKGIYKRYKTEALKEAKKLIATWIKSTHKRFQLSSIVALTTMSLCSVQVLDGVCPPSDG